MEQVQAGGLVLYKRRPALVKHVDDAGRVEIQAAGSDTRRVRPKDVVPLHAGPASLADLTPPALVDEVDAVRDLLADEGDAVPLMTLAEWLYGETTPAAVFGAWEWLDDGLHFGGDVDAVQARAAEEVDAERQRRQRQADEAAAWEAFLERLRNRACTDDDEPFLRDVVALAEGQRDDARALKALDRPETAESAHALLLEIGWWERARTPYARRAGHPVAAPAGDIPDLAPAQRLDLTATTAWAIDDEGNQDPDDAVAIDDRGRLWVHVADVAALVAPDDAVDVEARAHGATLYQPDGPVPMLPPAVVPRLGLGLADDGVGPALSFCLELSDDGQLQGVAVHLTQVRVERLTYAAADPLLTTIPDLARADTLLATHRQRRLDAGALDLTWPEARIRVERREGEAPHIDLQRLAAHRSRDLVAEAMIAAGAGAARFALDHALPLPFSRQEEAADAGDAPVLPGLPGAYALRRRQQPGRVTGEPARHSGLGLEAYARATSPLRRYVDLLVHQQLRAHLTGAAPLTTDDLMERAAQGESAAGAVRGIERQANRHWTLLWMEQTGWRGTGVVVDTRGRRGLLVCPEIAFETWAPVGEGVAVGTLYEVGLRGIDLPRLEANLELTPA